jgi:hypothetical protein
VAVKETEAYHGLYGRFMNRPIIMPGLTRHPFRFDIPVLVLQNCLEFSASDLEFPLRGLAALREESSVKSA